MLEPDERTLELCSEYIRAACAHGLIRDCPPLIPFATINTFNRVLIQAGDIVGWKDRNSYQIDEAALIKKLHLAGSIYRRARNEMIDRGIQDEWIENLSPVVVLGALLDGNNTDTVLSLASSHIYSSIALLNLARFRELCDRCLADEEAGGQELNVYRDLILAQSRLMIAQEAVNKALEIFFIAEHVVTGKVANKELIELQLEIEQQRSHRKQGPRVKEQKKKKFMDYVRTTAIEITALDADQEQTVLSLAETIRINAMPNFEDFGFKKAVDVPAVSTIKTKLQELRKCGVLPAYISKGGRRTK